MNELLFANAHIIQHVTEMTRFLKPLRGDVLSEKIILVFGGNSESLTVSALLSESVLHNRALLLNHFQLSVFFRAF